MALTLNATETKCTQNIANQSLKTVSASKIKAIISLFWVSYEVMLKNQVFLFFVTPFFIHCSVNTQIDSSYIENPYWC